MGSIVADSTMAERNLAKLRKICLALPETHEVLTWGEHPTFRVRNKIFVLVGADAATISIKADAEEREALLADEKRFYYPPYVGSKGWVGVHLTGRVDWTELRELIVTSYCIIAPKTLARTVQP
jgi:predicted DNA-binding protein (MmcQ/YjbR family)